MCVVEIVVAEVHDRTKEIPQSQLVMDTYQNRQRRSGLDLEELEPEPTNLIIYEVMLFFPHPEKRKVDGPSC